MTAFSLDPVQTAWCAELRALAEERLRPLAEKGEPGHVNRALVAELGRLGLLARLFTSGALDLCLMRESLARGCTEAETALALQGLGAHPVHAYGTRAQRERWLPRVADGSAVAAFALSEPGAGSDAAALALRADRDDARAPTSAPGPGEAAPAARGASPVASGAAPGVPGAVPAAAGTLPADPGSLPAASGVEPGVPGTLPAHPGSSPAASGVAPGVPGAVPAASGVAPAASGTVPVGPGPSVVGAQESPVAERDGWGSWRLSGEKCWISNAPEADFYTVFARTTPGAGARGVTAFLVPADRPGLTGTPLDMLSPHPIGALAFDAVPVTADDVLGEPDRGFRVAMHTLNLFRPSVGAFAVGMAEAALAATLTHTAGREAFGGRLKDLQTVAHQVAEMAMRTEAARLMVYAAAAAYDEGAPDVPRRAAMAKLLATETAQYVVDAAVQLHGARALRRGHLLEHLYREVRAPRIYEGASEVQRAVIAKELYASVEAP
ncbi:acyl-CoA dehydrogenase family protein [Streptomyces sp. WAC00263]|uniref:acyl-CoA dehydrogenase family protein n=1 Tax=Streptomyces sp. WAC00263 TaxID=1917422 RepID=UPI0015EFA8C7|nr:acyl-CoA dehydrogenase family protein [Streptomyces sp. WAC00263]KAF5994251.1 acyl-CoA dehydrogenase [Streptomyces sp. WAC00263]